MGAEICVFQNCTPGVGNYALRPPHYFGPVGAWTIRVNMRTSGQAPSVKSGATVTRLYDDIDIYDITYENPDWSELINPTPFITEVISANTTGVTNMSKLFYNQQHLTHIAPMDTSLVTDMNNMFYQCYVLQEIPMMDTSLVTNMNNMFQNCYQLQELPMLDTSRVEQLAFFMYACRSVQQLPALDLSHVLYPDVAFHGCSALTSLPQFDLSSCTSFQDMFSGCSSLTSIPAFTLPSTLQNRVCTAMFEECRSVESGAMALYNRLNPLRPKYYGRTFRNCGVNTTTGAAELAQIPSSWK